MILSSPILTSLFRMVGARVDRDGQAPALEASAGVPGSSEEDGEGGFGRRERRLAVPRDILDRSLAQKVLGGWLQNRHQVLVPLTFRLSRLEAGHVELLMRFAAVALLNGSVADAAARQSIERALRGIGADDAAIVGLDAALRDPTALSSLLRLVREQELSAYAYAITVMAADTRQPAGRLFANFIAARLELPADAVRSVDRRYRK